ncbi:hypothetical protein L202_02062 [Cryptococcus amylolentus CBS 6039]|uniref:DUF3835 domain-containing protein n=2 Tax=Cryptococcus amylolentus TaxID=104669 RepID=A0A1E3HZ79_9TREE|nr:hypothetical protein L202_02062 [Cryptococcus amylolentus CBS 6039]ODN81663.1 hypothetical protein L202_02062 [Cryptococcus amylolentus CBS 6039]ODO10130.1 hypothetical protein I350_02358 [Cryptococcus amylolentus CBS 6273]
MPPPLHLPIIPNTPSLADHLAALSNLSLNLSRLPSSPSPAVRVPLGAKASLTGTVSDTNTVLVCLGSAGSGGRWREGEQYWVKMTPDEAAAFVDRRRERILKEQARRIDGLGRGEEVEAVVDKEEDVVSLWHPSFYPVGAEPSTVSSGAPAGTTEQPGHPVEPPSLPQSGTSVIRDDTVSRPTVDNVPDIQPLPKPAPQQSKGSGKTPAQEPKANDLIEIMTEGAAAVSKEAKEAKDDETIYNEEGLPFHEIRETMDGKTIGDLPPPSFSSNQETVLDDSPDEYWTEAAVKRREALRKKLFHEGDSSDEEEVDGAEPAPLGPENDVTPKSPSDHTSRQSILRKTSSSSSTASSRSETPSSKPKSILKAPAQKKKSVKFDPSIPPSPSSPDPGPSSFQSQLLHGNKFGFPLPLAANSDDWGEKPVPVLNEPKPKAKATVLPIQAVGAQVVEKDDGFAGFKKGFLGGPPKVQSATSPATTPSSQPKSTPVPEPPKPKKTSLFAKRLAHSEVDASAPPTSSGATPATASPRGLPNLPRESESKGTSAVKSGVVEKAPVAPAARSQGKVVERTTMPSKPLQSMPPIISLAPEQDADHGDENDDDDDEDFSEFSSGSEDEYDLDDALLAREVALEYHKRRAYMSLNRDPRDRAMSSRPEGSEFEPEEGDFGEEEEDGRLGNLQQAGVMLGLPRIGDMKAEDGKPIIINPTADDLKRFVRVGRLENGNLVLAPGQEGLSDSEGEGEDGEEGAEDEDLGEKEERRKGVKSRRDEVRRKLLGIDVEESAPADEKKPELSERKGLPPALQTNVKEQSQPVAPVAAVEEPKKKISRFKAARMAGGQ